MSTYTHTPAVDTTTSSSSKIKTQMNDKFRKMFATHIRDKWLIDQIYKELLKIEKKRKNPKEK